MLEKQRHQLFLDLLDELEFASVPQLSAHLKSSEATIRRDINKLAAQDLIKKIRGGAQALEQNGGKNKRHHIKGSAFLVDKEVQTDAKRLIAKKAVEMCNENESIIINGGSSTYMMSEFLMERQMTILTNSFYLANELAINSDNLVTVPGGELYRKQGIILSSFENDPIEYYHATKMFMGTPGISRFGVMESDTLLIRAEQKLRKQADSLIILADATKVGARSNFIFTQLEHVEALITDSQADEKVLTELSREGVDIIIADSAS